MSLGIVVPAPATQVAAAPDAAGHTFVGLGLIVTILVVVYLLRRMRSG